MGQITNYLVVNVIVVLTLDVHEVLLQGITSSMYQLSQQTGSQLQPKSKFRPKLKFRIVRMIVLLCLHRCPRTLRSEEGGPEFLWRFRIDAGLVVLLLESRILVREVNANDVPCSCRREQGEGFVLISSSSNQLVTRDTRFCLTHEGF